MEPVPAWAEAESLVAMGERALHVDGDLNAARSWFARAYALAEEARAGELMAAAALGLGGLWVHEHRPVAEASSVEARQRTALSVLDPRCPLALRMRARLAAEADYRAGGHTAIVAILDEARRAGDPVALAEALSLAHHCLLGPQHAVRRLGLAEELLREGSRTHRPSDALMGLLWRAVDLFLLGDPHAERAFAELSSAEQANRNAAVGFVVSAIRVMLGIRGGRLAEAERSAQDCAERGRATGDADSLGWYGAQMVAIRWYQGRIGELVGHLSEIANSPMLSATDDAFLAALAVAAATAGNRRQARGALARLRGDDLGRLPRSSSWLTAMYGVIEAAALLDDVDIAARAYALLLPYARLPMIGSLGAACFGSAHHALGVASLTTREPGQAVEHFRAAIEQNTALGHWPAAALSGHRLGQALALRGERGDDRAAEVERAAAVREATSLGTTLPAIVGPDAPAETDTATDTAVCTRSGRHWRIELGGRSAVVDDSVGVRYLATLIANPAVEIPCIDLAEPPGPGGRSRAEGRRGTSPQAMLDEVALRQYRQRLAELRDDIAEAEVLNDGERATRLRAEAGWLADELQAATGLGGGARHFADNPERARIAVGKAIRRALHHISAADPALGEELCAAVQTGMRCCYRPSPATRSMSRRRPTAGPSPSAGS
ncbi:MAG TPA: hypothetical protein VLJ59_07405 [Mycobacteriales bacterium]|nr:hypothetical protein [Mycobacteriales bacterium]